MKTRLFILCGVAVLVPLFLAESLQADPVIQLSLPVCSGCKNIKFATLQPQTVTLDARPETNFYSITNVTGVTWRDLEFSTTTVQVGIITGKQVNPPHGIPWFGNEPPGTTTAFAFSEGANGTGIPSGATISILFAPVMGPGSWAKGSEIVITPTVPEPSTMLLLGTALGLGNRLRKKWQVSE